MSVPGKAILTWLPLLLAVGARAAVDLCPMNASVPAPPDARLEGDRLLVAGPPEISYPPDAYRPAPDGNGFVLCKCDGVKPCVLKCCADDMVYSVEGKCTKRNESLTSSTRDFSVPKFVNAPGTVGAYEADKFYLVYGELLCPETYRLEPLNEITHNFKISKKGFLLNESVNEPIIAPPGQFCLEYFLDLNDTIGALVCSSPIQAKSWHMYFTAFAMTLSLPFLFSTFLVYALIRDLQNLHGKSLMCHVAALLVAYSSLIFVQFMSTEINDNFCVILAHIVQFSFLVSFFWLNVMCFDLWWTFSGFRPLRGNLKEKEAKKFYMYSIYAWGSTFLIFMSTFYMDNMSNISSGIPRPEFGVNSCWFNTREAELIFFYGPIGVLLLSNLLMFIYTAFIIAKQIRNTKNNWKGSESNKNVDHERQRFMLYLKLFIVMGVNWSAEIISWALDPNVTEYFWYVTDIGNSLQGVLIFFIFVGKTRLISLLKILSCPGFSQIESPTVLSTRTTTNGYSSRNGTNTENEDTIEMNNAQKSSNNKLHDFKI